MEKTKIVKGIKGKVKNWKWEGKIPKWEEIPFKTTEIYFGSTKMEDFLSGKNFTPVEKIRKNDFAPSENFSCYAPARMGLELIQEPLPQIGTDPAKVSNLQV